MVQEERLRTMVKMAMFDKNEGEACKPMVQYVRTDYISLQLLRSFITGSAAFIIFCMIGVLYDIETFMQMLNGAYIVEVLTNAAISYVVFMGVYLLGTYVVYQSRYTKRRKMIKIYYKNLKNINKIYEREERLKTPVKQE